jgi:hypothetical protein
MIQLTGANFGGTMGNHRQRPLSRSKWVSSDFAELFESTFEVIDDFLDEMSGNDELQEE